MTARHILRARILVLASTIAAAILFPGPVQAQRNYYVATEIGGFGGRNTYASAMNNNGDVVGTATTPFLETPQAFLFSKGRTTHLGSLYGTRESSAMAINDNGAIVGRCGVAFLWEGGVMQDITLNLGAGTGYGTAINSKGAVVGFVYDGIHSVVFYYDLEGVIPLAWMVPPTIATNWTINYASDINNSGMIIGYGVTKDGNRGFLINGADFIDLGQNANPRAINNAGEAVGNDGSGNALLWSGTNATYLPISSSTLRDINDSGQIVGSYSAGNMTHPFLYDLGTKFDLVPLILGTNTDGVTLTDVICINNSGQIVVNGTSGYESTQRSRSFLLTPVPIIRNATNSSASTMNLTFWSMTNRTYTVQSSIEPSVWRDVTNVSGIAGDLTIPVATTNGTQRFYRVRMN
jgi:probable HAF family extracellular repeat protein